METGMKFIKYLLFIFNLLFAVRLLNVFNFCFISQTIETPPVICVVSPIATFI